MYRDFLAQSPLLALPLAALFLFLGVFVIVVTRTMARRAPEYARAAALPLSKEDRDEHR